MFPGSPLKHEKFSFFLLNFNHYIFVNKLNLYLNILIVNETIDFFTNLEHVVVIDPVVERHVDNVQHLNQKHELRCVTVNRIVQDNPAGFIP